MSFGAVVLAVVLGIWLARFPGWMVVCKDRLKRLAAVVAFWAVIASGGGWL